MNELERRALLGDKRAQKECTRKGILLPCPCCGCKPFFACATKGTPPEVIKVEWNYLIVCENCRVSSGMGSSFTALVEKWNTRPAPPIGRCKECMFAGNWENGEASCVINDNVIVDESSFCESFTEKEG